MATETTPESTAPDAQGRKKFHFPSAFTILVGVTVVVWLLAFIIPTGAYKVSEETGRPIPGSYASVDVGLSFVDRLMQLFLAPVNG
ncbi:MAG: hypothetical protein ACRDPJ_11180, partial [Nocardioidaceae bacterium]